MTTIWRPHWLIKPIIPVKEEVPDDDVPDVKVEPPADDDGISGEDEKTPSEGKGAKRKRAPRTKGPCEHGVKPRSRCKVCSACPHGRQRSRCKECGGGSICEHNRVRCECKECDGGSVCEHGRQRPSCPICDPCGHAIRLRRNRRYETIKAKNPTGTLKDLCMTSKEWIEYLHKTFEDRYSRPKTDNDKVQIDEIIPCSAWNLPDDNKYCWHYLNSQWLIDNENQEKSAKYTEEDKRAMIQRIDEWFTANPYQLCSTSSP